MRLSLIVCNGLLNSLEDYTSPGWVPYPLCWPSGTLLVGQHYWRLNYLGRGHYIVSFFIQSCFVRIFDYFLLSLDTTCADPFSLVVLGYLKCSNPCTQICNCFLDIVCLNNHEVGKHVFRSFFWYTCKRLVILRLFRFARVTSNDILLLWRFNADQGCKTIWKSTIFFTLFETEIVV